LEAIVESTRTAKSRDLWGTAITAGLLIGILEIFVELSLASLVFSGELSPLLPSGVGLFLLGSLVIGGVVLFTTSIPGTIAFPQDAPVALLAVIAAQISAGMLPGSASSAMYYTLLAAIVLSSLFTALVFLLLGWLKLGNLVRYIPYPVIGGFLGGTGWLLLVGSIGIMTDVSPTLPALSSFFTLPLLLKWLPGVILAILLYVVIRRTGNIRYLVLGLVGGMAVFYLVLLATGTPLSAAREQGFLAASFSEGIQWKPLLPAAWDSVQWDTVLSQAGTMGTIVLVSVISLLLNTSGIEVISRQNADLNRELRASGWANLLSGLFGSPVGYPTPSISALSFRAGKNSRRVGLVALGVIAVVLFFGSALLSFFPKMILGALVLFLGIDFLWDWLVDSWKALPSLEYALIVLIVVVIGAAGFLEGVFVGIGMSVVLFVINYSRIDVIRNRIGGENYHSIVERPKEQHRFLDERRESILILKLQGYLFFGTVHTLFETIHARAHPHEKDPLAFLVLDFQHVSMLDSSALNSFKKITQLAEEHGFLILFTACNPDVQDILQADEIFADCGELNNFFPSLDQGIEWCEEKILTRLESAQQQPEPGLLAMLSSSVEREDFHLNGLMDYLEPVQMEAGEKIIRQGEQLEFLYFIETGWATIYLEEEGREKARIRKMGPGTILGELSFLLDHPASASVVLNTDCRLYLMSKAQIAAMEAESPELAANFHLLITNLLGERLAKTTKTLNALLD
jgi:SulP family sulfate permease